MRGKIRASHNRPNDTARVFGGQHPRRHVLRDHGAGADDSSVADAHARADDGAAVDPDVVVDVHGECGLETLAALVRNSRLRPRFRPTDQNRAAIARVCRLVEGMPLAIELAASWGRVLTDVSYRYFPLAATGISRTTRPSR